MTDTESQHPRFSIIVPAFNAERYIEECLDSVLNQTYADFELIVVDDGSTDATAEIPAKLLGNIPNAHLLTETNQGPLLARREGVKNARGDYIVFLDADDTLNPVALERCAEALQGADIDILVFGMRRGKLHADNAHPASSPVQMQLGDDFKKEVLRAASNNLCGKAVKRTLFDLGEDYTLFANMNHGEDIFQLLPLVDNANAVGRLDQPLYFYRTNNDQGTASFGSSKINDLKLLIDRLKYYGEKWDDNESAYLGIIGNLRYLLEILSRSPLDYPTRRAHYNEIRKELGSAVQGYAPAGMRIRKKYKVMLCLLRIRAYRLLDWYMRKVFPGE